MHIVFRYLKPALGMRNLISGNSAESHCRDFREKLVISPGLVMGSAALESSEPLSLEVRKEGAGHPCRQGPSDR